MKKLLAGVFALVILIGIGIAIGWYGSRGPEVPAAPPPAPEPEPAPLTDTPSRVERDPRIPPRAVANTTPVPTNPPTVQPVVQPAPALPVASAATNWEMQLDEILVSEDDDTNKVVQLFALFATAPPEGKEDIVQHLSNLVEDENYEPLATLLRDSTLPEEVLDELMSDLLNRPDSAKLPLFLELARNPQHPKSEEARELLELYLDDDYGEDWAKWEQAVRNWLAENPD
ncbi:MAG TPA: hypothetical protein GYA07_13860 [Verrucomicrobia bacterium]|nr:hypothetical protein [Verrucomicrobiota bacterium]HOB31593.1 hypothetical protein [Verrucomicrobiota bacterium]HPU55218.1 hypothetical protein [Verrucomicrobiota bacterium]